MGEGLINAALATIRARSWVVGGRPLSGDQVVEVFRRIQRGQRRRNTLEDGRAFDQAIEVLKKAALVRFDRKLGWLAAGTPEWGRTWAVSGGATVSVESAAWPDLDRLEALAKAAAGNSSAPTEAAEPWARTVLALIPGVRAAEALRAGVVELIEELDDDAYAVHPDLIARLRALVEGT